MGEDELETWRGQFAPSASTGPPLYVPTPLPGSLSAVLQYAADSNIDLVVADTPPDRGPVPPLSADVPRALIQQFDGPVFVVEQGRHPAAIHDLFVPTDLSDPALRAYKHAVHLARLYDAAVHALHVVESLPYVALTPRDRLSLGTTPLSAHRGQRRLRAFLREGDSSGVPVHAHLTYGDAADQIVHFAEQEEADLVVLPSHGDGSHSDAPLGQVAQCVLGRVTRSSFLLPTFGTSLLSHSGDSEAGPAAS